MKRSVPSPLEAPLGEVQASIQPLVDNLGDFPGLVGAGLYMRDGFRSDTLDVVSIVDAPGASEELQEFNRECVLPRRIGVRTSAAGRALTSGHSGVSRSVMNPEKHVVFNSYMRIGLRGSAVLQLAVDSTEHTVDLDRLEKIGEQLRVEDVKDAVRELRKSVRLGGYVSLGDEMELDVPVTPNAFVAMWDVAGSTDMVNDSYGPFSNYYQNLGLSVMEIAERHGAKVVAQKGDGQNVVLPLPAHVDSNDPRSIAEFGKRSALPLVGDIRAANRVIGSRYMPSPDIRVGLSVGFVEKQRAQRRARPEISGPPFWGAFIDMKTGEPKAYSRIAEETLRLMAA